MEKGSFAMPICIKQFVVNLYVPSLKEQNILQCASEEQVLLSSAQWFRLSSSKNGFQDSTEVQTLYSARAISKTYLYVVMYMGACEHVNKGSRLKDGP